MGRSRLGPILGPTGYEPIKLLKALILLAWHNLSDTELEESLRVRMDFMLYSHSSIWHSSRWPRVF
ncbi:MAG: transposase [Holosporales bacterium]|nr:transposase [Holosporales bacterium]